MIFRKKSQKDKEPMAEQEERLPLEKGDFAAMMISGFIVYGPFVLILVGLMLFLTWLFGAFS